MAKAIEKKAKEKIFEAAGVDYPSPAKTAEIAVPAAAELVPVESSTRAKRKAQLISTFERFDFDEMEELVERLAELPSLLTEDLGEDLVLNAKYARVLMRQAIAMRFVKDLLEVGWEAVKDVAFDHFNASLAESGHPDPQHVNAVLEVAELGMKLRREGAGYGDSTIVDDKLRETLGDDWKKVYTRTVIPRQEVFTLDEDALWRLVQKKPELLEAIRDALQPGPPKEGRLNLRDI